MMLEIGPADILQTLVGKARAASVEQVALLKRGNSGENNVQHLLESLGK